MWEVTADEKVNAWETVLLSTFQVESVSEIHSKPKGRLLLEKLARIGTINFVRPCSVNPLASHHGPQLVWSGATPLRIQFVLRRVLTLVYLCQNIPKSQTWRKVPMFTSDTNACVCPQSSRKHIPLDAPPHQNVSSWHICAHVESVRVHWVNETKTWSIQYIFSWSLIFNK